MSWEGYTISDDYLSISFEGMKEARKKIISSIDAKEAQRENISRGIESLQVPDSVLRGYGNELIHIKNSISKDIDELMRMSSHIDYVMRRFEEVDNEYAARFKSASYGIQDKLGLQRESGVFGCCIAGLTPIVSQVTKLSSGKNNALDKKAAKLTYSPLNKKNTSKPLVKDKGKITAQASEMYLSQKPSATDEEGIFQKWIDQVQHELEEIRKAEEEKNRKDEEVKNRKAEEEKIRTIINTMANIVKVSGHSLSEKRLNYIEDVLNKSILPKIELDKMIKVLEASCHVVVVRVSGKYDVRNPIIDRLIKDTSLGLTKEQNKAMIDIATILLDEGYEPAFVAGVLGNVLAEGTSGYFESSKYKTHPENEPDYLIYMDKHFNYRKEFSGNSISEVGIKKTYDLLKQLQKINYEGKFGLGACQWTGGRTMELIKCYIEECGLELDANGNLKSEFYPTAEQCRRAENRLIVKELNGDYHSVYENWLSKYSKKDNAAYYAGTLVCKDYEKPRVDTSEERGNDSTEIYKVMMGIK